MDTKQKREDLTKEYTELNSILARTLARMRGIEGAIALLNEIDGENGLKEKKPEEEKEAVK